MDWLPVAVVIVLAMGFNYTNGFHDAANAIATSVSTRALTPRIALVMAAVFNLFGAFIGTKVAATVGKGIIDPPSGTVGLLIVGSALIGATAWNLLTWWKGLPSSSSHALFGGMVGASLAAESTVLWGGVLDKIVIPMVISPVLGLILGYFVMAAILWIFRRQHPGRTTRGFRYSQTLSAAAMALGHGLQDAGKTMGIIVLALTVGGYQKDSSIPLWVKISTALVISAGTTPVDGASCGRWAARSFTWIHLRVSPQRPPGRRSCISPGWASAPRSRPTTRSPPRSWVSAPPSGCLRCDGEWPRTFVTGWVLTLPGAAVVAALVYALTIPFH